MTIWKSKDELPSTDSFIYTDDGYLLYFELIDNPMTNKDYPCWSYNGVSEEYIDDSFEKWCYIDELLLLENRLKDAEEVIEYTIKANPNDEKYMFESVCIYDLKKKAQEYIKKYKD